MCTFVFPETPEKTLILVDLVNTLNAPKILSSILFEFLFICNKLRSLSVFKSQALLVSKSLQKTYLRRFVRDQKIQDHNKKWRLLEFSTDEDASPICIRRYAYQPTQKETEESEPEKEKKVTRTRKASKSNPAVEENFSDEEYE